MTIDPETGLSALEALSGFSQIVRRESSEWRSMNRRERREDILALVETAAKSSYVQDPEVRERFEGQKMLIGRKDAWGYYVHVSTEESERGWKAWHAVCGLVRQCGKEDPEQLAQPPLREWVARYVENPEPPKRKGGRPKGNREKEHLVAFLGVQALVDAGLCTATGKAKGGGSFARDLVAKRMGLSTRTVYGAWLHHRKELAAAVDERINRMKRWARQHYSGESEPCPSDILIEALVHVATQERLFAPSLIKYWRKFGELAKTEYRNFEVGCDAPEWSEEWASCLLWARPTKAG